MSLIRASTHFARATRHASRLPVRRLTTEPTSTSSMPSSSVGVTSSPETDATVMSQRPTMNRVEKEKRFVRIAGPASYVSRHDMNIFLEHHGVSSESIKRSLVQGQSDIFQNHTVWFLETNSQEDAAEMTARISGRVLGLKLIRAAAVDRRLMENMVGMSDSDKKVSLRRRMSVIAPSPDERGRALLARNLLQNLQPRVLWAFFSAYDVEDIRLLRRSGVACVVFETAAEANRALRERSNLLLQNQQQISLKMHD